MDDSMLPKKLIPLCWKEIEISSHLNIGSNREAANLILTWHGFSNNFSSFKLRQLISLVIEYKLIKYQLINFY
jgi:hypothetical protein